MAKQLKLKNLFAARIVLEKVLAHGRATMAQSIECQQELISVALQQQPVGTVLKMAEQHCENTHKQFMGKIMIKLGV